MAANALDEANSIIYGDREQTYGDPGLNLDKIGLQWGLYIMQKYGVNVPLNFEDVCYMMADLKKVRQMNAHKRDNLVDGIGYLALIDRVKNARLTQAQGADTPAA